MIVGVYTVHRIFSVEALWFVAKPEGCGMSMRGCRVIHDARFKLRGNTAQLALKLPGE